MTTAGFTAIPSDRSDFPCIDFVNSAFTDYRGGGGSIDRLDSPEWLGWFLDRHDLSPDDGDTPPLAQLRTLRRDLRRILDKWCRHVALSRGDLRMLDARLREAPFRIRLDDADGSLALRAEPLQRSWEWVAAQITASAVELQRDGDPNRLKTCGNPDCSWMFYDTSTNRSKQFCSTTPCGSLIRVRRFRQRL